MFSLPTLSIGDVQLAVRPLPDRASLEALVGVIEGIRGVERVAVDQYAGGESHLTARLDRPTAFAGELRAALRRNLESCRVEDGRLVVVLAPASDGPAAARSTPRRGDAGPDAECPDASAAGSGFAFGRARRATAGARSGEPSWVDGWDRAAGLDGAASRFVADPVPPFADLVERDAAGRALDELADISILAFDRELRFTSRAGGLYTPLGRTFEMIRGLPASEVVRGATWDVVQRGYEGAILGRTESIDFPGLEDGAIHESTFSPLMDGTTIIGGLVITRDVTEARRTARLLDELHAVLRVTFDHSPIGMGLLTTTGRWVRANPVLQSLLGMDEARLVTGRLQDVTHPEDLAAEQALGAALLAGERDHYVLAKRLLDAGGRDVPVLATTTLLRGSDGEPHGLICQVTRQEG